MKNGKWKKNWNFIFSWWSIFWKSDGKKFEIFWQWNFLLMILFISFHFKRRQYQFYENKLDRKMQKLDKNLVRNLPSGSFIQRSFIQRSFIGHFVTAVVKLAWRYFGFLVPQCNLDWFSKEGSTEVIGRSFHDSWDKIRPAVFVSSVPEGKLDVFLSGRRTEYRFSSVLFWFFHWNKIKTYYLFQV